MTNNFDWDLNEYEYHCDLYSYDLNARQLNDLVFRWSDFQMESEQPTKKSVFGHVIDRTIQNKFSNVSGL